MHVTSKKSYFLFLLFSRCSFYAHKKLLQAIRVLNNMLKHIKLHVKTFLWKIELASESFQGLIPKVCALSP